MRTWVKPSAIEENFASNQNIAESVTSCYSLYCMISGDGKGHYTGDAHSPGSPFKWANIEVQPDKYYHGQACARGASYDKKTGKFYEHGKPKVFATDINISNIPAPDGNGYQATWKSKDDVTYQHYGYAINDATNHPNHS